MKPAVKPIRLTRAEVWLLGEYDLLLDGTHPIAVARLALIGLLKHVDGLSKEQKEQSEELIGQMERCGGYQQLGINRIVVKSLARSSEQMHSRKPESRRRGRSGRKGNSARLRSRRPCGLRGL